MSADNESEAVLRLRIVDELAKAARDLDRYRESIGDTEADMRSLGNTVNGAIDKLNGAAKAADGAGKKLKSSAEGASKEWNDLAERVEKAAAEYRKFQKEVAVGNKADVGVAAFMGEQGVSSKDLAAYRRGTGASLLGDDTAVTREQERRTQYLAELKARSAAAEGAAAQKSAQIAREAVAAIERESAAHSAAYAKEFRENASLLEQREALQLRRRYAGTAANSRFATRDAYMSTVAERGAGRGFGTSSATRTVLDPSIAQRSTSALARYDAQLNRTTASYKASTSALAQQIQKQEENINQLPRLRYAMYDVALTAGIMGTAIAGTGIASLTAFGSMESAFTNVERTLEPGTVAVGALRGELMQLSREIPLTFQDISAIATLGNQLGVEGQNVAEFTGTVARFSAVAGVSADETAKAFGSMTEILGVAETEYENLGSAIALVGRRSVATEPEILALTREIGQQASSAGFSASAVVGLAGALGELRLPPERSRGALTTYFQTLNQAVAEGGDRLEMFAQLVGVTGDQLSNMVRNGQGEDIMRGFLGSLNDFDNVGVTQILDELGLAQLRVSDVFQRLSSNMDVFNANIATGNQGYAEGNELARQYAMVLDDLASRWQIFVNALTEFGAAFGAAIAPAATAVLDAAAGALQGFAQFLESDFGQQLAVIITRIGVLAAAILAVVSSVALGVGSMAALRTAIGALGLSDAITRARLFAASLTTVDGRSKAAAGGVMILRGALAALLRATIIGGALLVLSELIFNFGGSMQAVIPIVNFFVDAVGWAATSIAAFSEAAWGAISWMPGALGDVARQGQAVAGTMKQLAIWKPGMDAVKNGFADWANGLTDANDGLGDFQAASDSLDWGNWADGIGAVDDFGSGVDDATAKVRTLVDYAGDLQGVFDRSFQIRFGSAQAQDSIAGGWLSIADAAASAREAVAGYQRTIAELTADRSIKEYWLRNAEMYKDELRAAELRAELADTNAEITKTQKSLTKEQEKASMTLDGNSQAALDNRAALLGLVGNYQSYINSLASSGMSQDQLRTRAAQLKQEFIQQATQMGFNRESVLGYAASFDDMTVAINGVPRDITVSANVNPALQALAEFEARAAEAARNAAGSIANGGGLGYSPQMGDLTGLGQNAGTQFKNGFRLTANGTLQYSDGTYTKKHGEMKFLHTGGYVGDGGKFEPKGIVHGGEFVFSKEATSYLGAGFLSKMHSSAQSGRAFVPTGTGAGFQGSGSGATIVELGPATLQFMAQNNIPIVMLDGRQLAGAIGAQNAASTRLGGS